MNSQNDQQLHKKQTQIRQNRRRKRNPNDDNKRRGKRTARLAHLKDYCNDESVPRFDSEECLANLQETLASTTTTTSRKSLSTRACSPLLSLLRQREVGAACRNNRKINNNYQSMEKWQSRVLLRSLEDRPLPTTANNSKARKGWRPFASRSVPFTALRTPSNDAILALDRFGSFALALGDRTKMREDDDTTNRNAPVLALSFYGIPSPAVLHDAIQSKDGQEGKTVVSPLLQTITLLSKGDMEAPFSRQASQYPHYFSRSWTEPTNILISSDWQMGVAFLLNTIPPAYLRQQGQEENQQRRGNNYNNLLFENERERKEINLGTMVIFSCPTHNNASNAGNENETVHTFKLPNVKMASFNALTMRNLLWRVNQIPVQAKSERGVDNRVPEERDFPSGYVCGSIMELPGYLLFNDEYDGFRLVWITFFSNDDCCVQPVRPLSYVTKIPNRNNDIVSRATNESKIQWKEEMNERQSGMVASIDLYSTTTTQEMTIAFEAYLSITNILKDMLSNRRNLAYMFSDDTDDPMPDFCYNLLSVNDGGRTVDIVIVCKPKDKAGCIGIFVTVDLFTENYRENKWIQNSKVSDHASLQKLCNALALNRRMRQRRVGPYSVNPDDDICWENLCEEKYFYSGYDYEMDRDLDPDEWKPFVDRVKDQQKGFPATSTEKAKPKIIPYSSLYPDCEMMTTRTISAVVPAAYLTGRRSPLRLLYC